MKIVKYDPKETFGLVYRVHPLLDERADKESADDPSYSVYSDGCIVILGRLVRIDVAQRYLEGLAESIKLAKGELE